MTIDDIIVLSYYGKCPCGEIIPYGQLYCKGHGRIRTPYINRICHNCKQGATYLYKGKYPQWRRDKNDNLICKKCYDRFWYCKNPDYNRVWNLEHPDYRKVWYLEHREEMLNYSKVWRLEHLDL